MDDFMCSYVKMLAHVSEAKSEQLDTVVPTANWLIEVVVEEGCIFATTTTLWSRASVH